MQARRKPGTASFFRYALLSLLAMVMIAPIGWIAISSLRPPEEIFLHSPQLSWRTFVPEKIIWSNYEMLLASDFPQAVLNTAFVAFVTVVLGILICSAAGFAFAVFDFPFKNALFVVVIITFIMPFESIVVPLYIMVRGLNWNDTYFALIMPEVASGFIIFLFRQFFVKVSRELFEAARVDGASWWRIYWDVALPLSWPTVVAGALMMFIHQWDAFFWPLVAATSQDLTMVQVAIARYQQFEQADFGRLFAAMTVASLLAILPFMALQRYYIRTIIDSGFK
ncbi:MAG: carbohydrate ABC transporter permease [Rhodobacteraceae bacterium]|nr:carbohydrate ABC transporter permease [Paracoccaceae bacterium]